MPAEIYQTPPGPADVKASVDRVSIAVHRVAAINDVPVGRTGWGGS